MDNISPLAKTLAESNGIDWRTIKGTGPGGQIVDEDIINYLTRVMSGEEEPPPTPVDLPPPDWTGDELPAGMSAEMLSQAGVESDIAALVNQVPVAEAPAGQSAQLEEDDFELDLEDEAPATEPQQPAAALSASEFDLPATPTPAAQPAAAAPQAAAPAGSLGGLLSQLYQTPARSEAAPTQPEPQQSASSTFGQPSAATSSFGGYGESRTQDEPQVSQPAAVQDSTEPAYAQAEATQPVASDEPRFTAEREEAAPVQASEPVTPSYSQAAEVTPAVPEPVRTEEISQPIAEPEYQTPAEPVAVGPMDQVVADEVAEASAPQVPVPVAPASTTAAPQGERPEKAVWFGVYLRRDADLEAASTLREQLNAALGQDVPLSLLVARAAQQHAGLLGLNAVAIQDVYSHRARSVGAPGAGLRDALSAIDRDHDGQADLLVVNAGTFDLDELHYPDAVTLSLGRVQDGRAALSLNGDVETTKAAEFLAAVVASLEAPVALII